MNENNEPRAAPIEKLPLLEKYGLVVSCRTKDTALIDYVKAKADKSKWIEAVLFLAMITEQERGVNMLDAANKKREQLTPKPQY